MAKAQAGQISLGDIDDQLGGLGQDYANVAMVTELTGFLPQQQRQDCSLSLHRRIYSDYTEAGIHASEWIGCSLCRVSAACGGGGRAGSHFPAFLPDTPMVQVTGWRRGLPGGTTAK
ncbi:MAG: hypothetical protein M3Y27_12785 [Acidobacteriota bacterium]|nr:hypothetical protein [Acidobacteriota bacterium]